MLFMNEYEIADAVSRHRNHPLLSPATKVLADLQALVDSGVCDGWCYWPIPVRAAQRLIKLIKDTPPEQVTRTDVKKAFSPIKAMLTKHKDVFKGWRISFPEV